MLATVSVHAAGEVGQEAFNLIIGDQIVQTFDRVRGDHINRDFQVFTHETIGDVSADMVKVEFFNDFTNPKVDVDRNLFVDKIVIDGVSYETEADTTFSTGYFQGDTFSGPGFLQTEELNVNGTFHFLQDNTPIVGTRIRIDAMGDTGEENVQLQINGETVKNFRFADQAADSPESFFFVVDDIVDIDDIRIRFTNDFQDATKDRNLTVFGYHAIDLETGDRQYVNTLDSKVFSTEGDNTRTLTRSGFFEVRENLTRFRVDASGDTGDEILAFRVGNDVLKQVQVSTTKRAYFVDINRDVDLEDLQVSFVNDLSQGEDYDRNLTVHSFQRIDLDTLDREIVRPTDYNVFSNGTFLDADGIVSGFGRGDTLNASGFFQVRELPNGYSVDRQVAGAAYIVKQSDHSGNFIAVFGQDNGSLVEERLTMFDANGKRVRSFGDNGNILWRDVADVQGWNKTSIQDIDFLADGSIVVTALRTPDNGNPSLPYILKLDSNGGVDDSFSINGLITDSPIRNSTKLITLAEADGHITTVGTGGQNVLVLSHYDEFGELDPSYGTDGHKVRVIGNAVDLVDAVALPDDSVLVMLKISSKSARTFNVLKFDNIGRPDTSFGFNGIIETGTTSGPFGDQMLVDDSGRITVPAGITGRFLANGDRDASFW